MSAKAEAIMLKPAKVQCPHCHGRKQVKLSGYKINCSQCKGTGAITEQMAERLYVYKHDWCKCEDLFMGTKAIKAGEHKKVKSSHLRCVECGHVVSFN